MNSNKSFEAASDQARHIILLQQKNIYIFYLGKISNSTYNWLSVSKGFGSRAPVDTKIYRWRSPLYKMAQNLHITYTDPPIYFKSSLKVKVKLLSLMGLFATPCTVAHQQVESKDFRTLEYGGPPVLNYFITNFILLDFMIIQNNTAIVLASCSTYSLYS